MITLTTKPRIVPSIDRDDYAITVRLRIRRPWRKMSPEERLHTLNDAAAYLETVIAQMRDEANAIDL